MDGTENPAAAPAGGMPTEVPFPDALDGAADDWSGIAGGMPESVVRAMEFIATGGPVVAILLAMSVLALTLSLIKLWQFRAARLGDRACGHHALVLWRSGRRREALAVLRNARNPVARVLAVAMGGQLEGVLPEARLREEVVRVGADILEELRGFLRPLELIGSLAPLLGLFGTVLGMIAAFRQLERAGNQVNPAILSGGIWEALLTTAVGLAVAIPAVALHTWFERRVERLAHAMDSAATQVFTVAFIVPAEQEPVREPARLSAAAAGE